MREVPENDTLGPSSYLLLGQDVESSAAMNLKQEPSGTSPIPAAPLPELMRAAAVNNVLTRLVCKELSLRPEHRARLLARGLVADEFTRLRYVSAPLTAAERQRAADARAPYLDACGGGIPGFYRERGRWRMVYRPPGFFIPVRDACGHIQALSQRVDDPRDGAKYLWLSSADRDGGASSAARNVEKGKLALSEMDEDSLVALLESSQGEELRRTLLKLQADIAEALETFPQMAEGESVEEGLGHFDLTPPEPEPGDPRADDVAAWEEVERRAAGAPRVTSREVQLCPPPPDELPPALPTQSVEEAEAEAVRAEACGRL